VRQFFAAHARVWTKVSTRFEIGARIRTKNSVLVSACDANHPTLIRSFLIDSGPRTPFATQITKIIFACADVCVARDVDTKANRHAQKNLVARRQHRNDVIAKSPYSIALFAMPLTWVR